MGKTLMLNTMIIMSVKHYNNIKQVYTIEKTLACFLSIASFQKHSDNLVWHLLQQ